MSVDYVDLESWQFASLLGIRNYSSRLRFNGVFLTDGSQTPASSKFLASFIILHSEEICV